MPVSRPSTSAAAVEGARPITGLSPASSRTWRSIVVLPVPALPCTPTTRSRDSRIVRTASSCPSVSPAPSRRTATSSSRARASPAPIPAFIDAIVERSAFRARSVTKARSARESVASTKCPSPTIRAIASRISPIECRPGEWPRASASSWCSGKTDCRSSSCRTQRRTISSADGPSGSTISRLERAILGAVSRPFACARSCHSCCSCDFIGSAFRLRVASVAACIALAPRSQPLSST